MTVAAMKRVALAIWAVLALGSGPAAAHVTLVEAEPADGAVVATAPATRVLRFADPVAPIAAQIVGAGVRLPVKMRGDEETVHLELPRRLAAGPYIVSWRVGSLDDHPVTGSLMFIVGPAAAGTGPAAAGTARGSATDHGRKAEIEISPAVAGRNLIAARIGLKASPKEVAVELAQKEAGIEPLRRALQLRDGAYVLEGPELLVPGMWSLSLEVLVDDFDKAFFDVEIPIR